MAEQGDQQRSAREEVATKAKDLEEMILIDYHAGYFHDKCLEEIENMNKKIKSYKEQFSEIDSQIKGIKQVESTEENKSKLIIDGELQTISKLEDELKALYLERAKLVKLSKKSR